MSAKHLFLVCLVVARASSAATGPPLPKLASAAQFTMTQYNLEHNYTISRYEMYSHELQKFRVDMFETTKGFLGNAGMMAPGKVGDISFDPHVKGANHTQEGSEVDWRYIADFSNGHLYRINLYRSHCTSKLMGDTHRECNSTDADSSYGRLAEKYGPPGGEEQLLAESADDQEARDKQYAHAAWDFQEQYMNHNCHWAGMPKMLSSAQLFHWGSEYEETYLGKALVNGVTADRWQATVSAHSGPFFSTHHEGNYTLDYYFMDPSWRTHINRKTAEKSLPDGYGIPLRVVLRSMTFANIASGDTMEFPSQDKPLEQGELFHVFSFVNYEIGEPHPNMFLIGCELQVDRPDKGHTGNCTEILNRHCYEADPVVGRTTLFGAFVIGLIFGLASGFCATATVCRCCNPCPPAQKYRDLQETGGDAPSMATPVSNDPSARRASGGAEGAATSGIELREAPDPNEEQSEDV